MFSPSEGKLIADRYLLEREIARGGMGTVWRAFDQQLGAPCALKFILQAFATHEELRARFVREARAIAAIQSPHLVAIRGVGECEDSLYIAMELMEGETLQQYLDREGKLSPEQTALLVDQVSSVLTKAHALGIVHRDLKPENLWLWEDGPFFIKVLDFGVAKHVMEGDIMRTATGALVGTPHYMSPEQAEGARSVDHRADVWALAVIAIECLSGAPPFDGNSLAELLIKIARTAPPPIAAVAPGFLRLEAWWTKATARAEERHSSVRELATEFRAAINSVEPGPATVPTANFAHAQTQLVRIEPAAPRPTLDSTSGQRSSTTAPFTTPTGAAAVSRVSSATPLGSLTEDAEAVDVATLQTLVPPPISWKPAIGIAALLALAGVGYAVWNRGQVSPPSAELTAASAANQEAPTQAAAVNVAPSREPERVHAANSEVPTKHEPSAAQSVHHAATEASIAPHGSSPTLQQVVERDAPTPVVAVEAKTKAPVTPEPGPRLAKPSDYPNKSTSGSAPSNERGRRRPSADVDQRLGF